MNINKKIGARILSEANDLKRTPSSLAYELGVSFDHVQKVINGDLDIQEITNFVTRMVNHYPINFSDLIVPENCSDSDVFIFSNNASKSSSRIFERKNKLGNLLPYYEYRDTAMSKQSPFRPEWIRPLTVVNDSDPNNTLVVYNRGHLLHQTTFFIGKVNFYWQVNGKSNCVEMNTGDSNIITPFYPHSFSSRDPNNLGLILACTYAGSFRNSLNEMSLLSPDKLHQLSGNLSSAAHIFKSKLNRYLNAETISIEAFQNLMVSHGFNKSHAIDIINGEIAPDQSEIYLIANLLHLPVTCLMGTPFDQSDSVVNIKHDARRFWSYPTDDNCHLKFYPLVRSKHQPLLKCFTVEVMKVELENKSNPLFSHGLFEYIYNYGDIDVELLWGEHKEALICPGDSVIISPMVSHTFRLGRSNSSGGLGKLYVVRAPGRISDDALDEYAKFCKENRERSLHEDKTWF